MSVLTSSSEAKPTNGAPFRTVSPEEQALLDALRGLRFGTVEVTVHEARIVQIARTEKLRV